MLRNPRPSHPGVVLSEVYLNQLGWTQTRLAQELGCAHRKINEIVNGKRSISAECAIELERVLGTEAEMWVRLQAEFDLYQARKKRRVA
jgi:addiction module HigA family antidote